MAYAVGSAANGGIMYSDGSVVYPKQGPLLPGQDQNAFRQYGTERSGGSNPWNPTQSYNQTPSGQILGTSITTPSGGGGGGGAGTSFISSPQPTQAPDNSGILNAIRARLDEARNTARGLVSRAGEERDYLTGQIKDQFGQLRQRAEDRRTNSLGTLDQEGTKLANVYARAQGDARRRAQNAETANLHRARALNRPDSSFYDELQAGNTADLTRGLGVLDVEQADKNAALGIRRTETNQTFDEILQDVDTQQQQAEREAVREYQNAVAQGEALERAGVLDYGEGVQQAQAAYQSRLDQIAQASQNLALQKLSLSAQIAQGGQNINSFNAINESLSGTLGDNGGIESVMAANPNILGTAVSQVPTVNSYYNQNVKEKDPYAPYITYNS